MLLAVWILANEGIASPIWTPLSEPTTRVIADPCHPGRTVEATDTISVNVVTSITASDIQNLPTRGFDMNVLTRLNSPVAPIRSQTRPLGGDPDRTAIGFNEIDKIEVLRGPTGTLYGRDLFSGVIQAVTKADTELRAESSTFDCSPYLKDDAWTKVRLSYKPYDLWANASVYRSTELAGHTEPKLELLGQSRIYTGSYLRAQPVKTEYLPDNGQFGGPTTNYFGSVGGIKFTPQYAEKLGTPGIWLPRRQFDAKASYEWNRPVSVNPSLYLQDSFRTFGENNVTGWVAKSGLDLAQIGNMMKGAAAQGEGMSRLRFPGDPALLGNPECGSELDYPSGTIWYPDEEGYQAMMSTSRLRYQFAATWATTGVDADSLQKEMESHCLNMALKEPKAGVRYFPYASPDPIVSELAKIAESSMLRGPWDQARTWIYTDKASMDEVNERLLPRIGPSQYVNGLWDVVSRGGFGPEEMQNPKFFEPKLLVAAGAKDDAFRWFANYQTATFGAATAEWLVSNPSDLQRLFSGDATTLDKKHLPRLYRALLVSTDAGVRKAALASLKAASAGVEPLKDGIGTLRRSLYSTDPTEVDLALDACSRFVSKPPAEAIRYLAAKGETDSIRAKAASLATR